MTRKDAGTAYVRSGALRSSHPLLKRVRLNREAGQRPDQHGQEHRHQTDEEAVAELVPEILDEPVSLGQDGLKAVKRWVRRPDEPLELDIAFIAIERDQQHVVDGRQRPDHERDAEYHRRHFGEERPQPMARAERRRTGRAGDAHNCTSLVWSVRIRMITIGISTGRADMTAATPSDGWAASKA